MHRPVRWTSSATELNLATPIIHPNPIRTMEDPGGECRCSDLTCIANMDSIKMLYTGQGNAKKKLKNTSILNCIVETGKKYREKIFKIHTEDYAE